MLLGLLLLPDQVLLLYALFAIPWVAFPIWFIWRALQRAGLAGPLALLWLVPFGQLVVLGILAFSEWPNLRKPSGSA
jgi:hypothetical protein